MFCKNCGAEIDDNAVVCPKCGVAVHQTMRTAADDAPNTGFMVLSIFFPLIGFILYLVWHTESPLKAKSCGKGAIIGIIIGVVLGVVLGIIYGSLIGSMLGSIY
ncbi:MAG: zinc ribbon domain-containing protein [Clostridia bacterium]|nr:zinc ribbon domain-containing protein [Clostridia bacterium]MDE6356874.1 zinc ribbon domain-containing protein [Clostridia bacterium]MDE7214508.1 zinc ribbon domain-containing protein [Clostridia bacterium]